MAYLFRPWYKLGHGNRLEISKEDFTWTMVWTGLIFGLILLVVNVLYTIQQLCHARRERKLKYLAEDDEELILLSDKEPFLKL